MKRQLFLGLLLVSSLHAFAQPTTIRFGVEPADKPFEWKLPDGTLTGVDIDLGNAICEVLKAKCVWVENDFDSIIPALKAKKFDAILSGMAINAKRLTEIDFTQRLYKPPVQLIGKADSGLLPTPESLKGKRVGVQQGTTHETYANKYWRPAGVEVVAYKSAPDVFLDLANGRLDAALNNAATAAENFLSTPRGVGFSTLGGDVKDEVIFGVGVGIGVRKDDPQMKEALNNAIADLKRSGQYSKITTKYFKFDISGDAR